MAVYTHTPLQTDVWTPREPDHELLLLTLPQPLHPRSLRGVRARSTFGRNALLCHCHLMPLSPPFLLLSSLLRSRSSPRGLTSPLAAEALLTPHELNMDKQILQLTGGMLRGGGFTEAPLLHLITAADRMFLDESDKFRCSWTSVCVCVCVCVCGPHLC